ncbi:hypothetical protein FB451DRAFT_1534586 [Mycena latifolia]|nr:hypothetical protein FB451DRAFT_1534586 [Mycena latifolia]
MKVARRFPTSGFKIRPIAQRSPLASSSLRGRRVRVPPYRGGRVADEEIDGHVRLLKLPEFERGGSSTGFVGLGAAAAAAAGSDAQSWYDAQSARGHTAGQPSTGSNASLPNAYGGVAPASVSGSASGSGSGNGSRNGARPDPEPAFGRHRDTGPVSDVSLGQSPSGRLPPAYVNGSKCSFEERRVFVFSGPFYVLVFDVPFLVFWCKLKASRMMKFKTTEVFVLVYIGRLNCHRTYSLCLPSPQPLSFTQKLAFKTPYTHWGYTEAAAAHRILSESSQQFPSRKPQLCPQRCIRTSPSLITPLQLRGFEPRAANTTGIGSCGAAPKSLVSAASSGGRWEGVGNLHNVYGMGWDRMEDDVISMRLTSEGPERTAKCEIRNYLGAWPNTDKHPEKFPFSVYI